MSKFIADLLKFSEEDRAFFSNQFKKCLNDFADDFPEEATATMLSYAKDENFDLFDLPQSLQNMLCKFVCKEISYVVFTATMAILEKDNIKEHENGHFQYTNNGWSIWITKGEIINTLDNYMFDTANFSECDIHSFIGACNCIYTATEENYTSRIKDCIIDFADNKWARIMAEKADDNSNLIDVTPKEVKKNWLQKILGL